MIRSFRNELYAGYKTEEGVEQALLSQFPLVEEAMAALGLVVWPMVEFEADDALASGAARFAPTPSRCSSPRRTRTSRSACAALTS